MAINYILIKQNGCTITGQKETVFDAAAEVRKTLADPFYNQNAPIKKIFLCDGQAIMEYLPSEIEDRANWQEGH